MRHFNAGINTFQCFPGHRGAILYVKRQLPKADDRQAINMSRFYRAIFVGRQYRLIFMTRERHENSESADDTAAN